MIALVTAVVAFVLVTSFTGGGTVFGDKWTRKDKQGSVTVNAKYLISKENTDKQSVFQLSFDTHSVDLDKYDIEKVSYIQFDDQAPINGGVWDFTGSAHHFKGFITYKKSVPEERKTLRLLIRDVAGVSVRVLEWELPQNENA